MYDKAIAYLLIGISSFTAVAMTNVNVEQDGKLSISTSAQKADARRVPIPKPRPKPKPTKPGGSIDKLFNGASRIYRGLEVVNNVVDGYQFVKSLNGGDIFISPDELAVEWGPVATACDKVNGRLIWRNDLKTCIPR